MRHSTLLVVFALPTLAPATLPAQATATPALPPTLHWEALAFDGARDRIVLFGGVSGAGGYLAGTWGWRDRRWTMLADSASGPEVRHAHAMANDPTRRRVLLFGGVTEPRGGAERRHCDTWALDDAGWSRLSDASACITDRPGAATLVHDDRTSTLLLLEGPRSPPSDTVPRPLRLWRLQDTRWVLADSSGPRRLSPGGAAWDMRRDVLVVPVLEGPDFGVWEWDGRRWVRTAAGGPAPRGMFAVAWAAHLDAIVLAGGRTIDDERPRADVWMWDGRRWTPLPDAGEAPAARSHATLLADPARPRLAYFGGAGAGGLLRDLWWLERGGWRVEGAAAGAGR